MEKRKFLIFLILNPHSAGFFVGGICHSELVLRNTQDPELGECDELNSSYYLVGKNIFAEKRIVADAGHILRHFLPNWYKT